MFYHSKKTSTSPPTTITNNICSNTCNIACITTHHITTKVFTSWINYGENIITNYYNELYKKDDRTHIDNQRSVYYGMFYANSLPVSIQLNDEIFVFALIVTYPKCRYTIFFLYLVISEQRRVSDWVLRGSLYCFHNE